MANWISENWLAFYGALTGTAALAINFFSYRHNRNKERIKIAVSFSKHPKQATNILSMQEGTHEMPWKSASLVEVYLVTVRNVGNIPAPLESVGVVTGSGKDRPALITLPGQSLTLEKASGSNMDALQPKSSRTFSTYLNRDEELYSVSKAYAVDQTGRRWESDA